MPPESRSTSVRTPQRFRAGIYKLGINPCVDVPRRVSQAFGRRGYVPVVGTLNGHRIRATLVPKGGGAHRLYVNGAMRKTAGVDVGDTVHFELRFDPEPRDLPVPADFRQALREEGAEAAWEELTPSHRKELIVVILDAKRPETRVRRIHRAIYEHVLARKTKRGKR